MNKPLLGYLIGFLLFMICHNVVAQADSIVLKNGDFIVGEMKSMDKGILIMETPYSDKDFNIKWMEIKEVFSKSRFLITMQDGRRMNSKITSNKMGEIIIEDENGLNYETSLFDVVYLKGVKSDFWSRVNVNIDLGISFTKSNEQRQFNFQTAAGYTADEWSTDLFYDDFRSWQDSLVPTKRNEAGFNYRYFLKRDWYILPAINYLSNTEQGLIGRLISKFGVGRFIFHSNKAYWGLIGGLSLNTETFKDELDSHNSAELFAGSELDLFDTGDLSLLSNIYLYPSLTEKGRFRTDFKIDTKYEFVEDFYAKLSLTFNYDNQPALEGKEIDYVFGVSFGYELE